MLTRRKLLKLAAAGGLGAHGLASLGCSKPMQGPPAAVLTDADFTIAFLTDPHVYADKGAGDATVLAFEHAMARERRPEMIITGGDLVFDLLEVGREEADAQFDILDRALESVDVPIHHTLGNHDLLGVYESSGMSPGDELYGKAYFLERFGLDRAYYSFDHEGWHFVVLDTVQIVGRKYRGWIDEEQIAWLEDDLASSGRPTVVIGHIPIVSNFIEWREGTSEGIPDRVSVANSHQVASVLERHSVRLVLAGHLHINETYRYKHLTFATVGAVSGNWWDGPRDGFEEGYALLEFSGDEVAWRYVDYGWEARTGSDA